MERSEIMKIMRKTYNRWSLNGYTNGLLYLLKIKDNFDTAAWTIAQKEGKKVNVIYIGDHALEMGEDNASQERLLGNLLHHEFGHSKFTDQDLEHVKREVEKIYGTFELLNLFEDCRMEHKVRNLTKHRFNWFNYIKPQYMGVGHHHPESLLLALKNAESVVDEDRAQYAQEQFVKAFCCAEFQNPECMDTQEESQTKAEAVADRVRNYYMPLTTKAPSTLSLMPIIKEWLEEFYDVDELKRQQEIKERLKELAKAIADMMKKDGVCPSGRVPDSGLDGEEDGEESGSGTDDGESDDGSEEGEGSKKIGIKECDDLTDSKELSKGGKAADKMDEGTEEVAGNTMTKADHSKDRGRGKKIDIDEHGTLTDEEFSSADLLSIGTRYRDTPYDKKEAAKLLPVFERFLRNQSQNISTIRPSKRMSTRNVMLDRDKIYKRKHEIVKGEKVISMVVDCSGSMGRIMHKMKVVIAVINNLAMKHKVSGNIMLSSGEGYQTLKLPILDEDVDNISGFSGSEGLERTMTENIQLLKKSDYVFVLTDGDITDGPIDKKRLAKHRVKPIGLYIGQEAKNLSKWFDKYVNKETPKATVDEMARKIK